MVIKKKKESAKEKKIKCWEFFRCSSEQQKQCLMPEVEDWRCWLANVACCKMNKDAPRPLSIKNVICKTCDFYKEFNKY